MERRILNEEVRPLVYRQLLRHDINNSIDREIISDLLYGLRDYEALLLFNARKLDEYYLHISTRMYSNSTGNIPVQSYQRSKMSEFPCQFESSYVYQEFTRMSLRQQNVPKQLKDVATRNIASKFAVEGSVRCSYYPWSYSKEIFCIHQFVPLRKCLCIVVVAMQSNFEEKKVPLGLVMRETVSQSKSMFARNVRFSNNEPCEMFIDITMGIMGNLFMNMLRTLEFNYSDRNSCITGNIAFLDFARKFIEIAAQNNPDVLCIYGVYNQRSFEDSMGIRWCSV
ncbi:uncharacterized protein [Prorops nasuta]|uniref:uncharacterized protein n=1 Tax=Prorops nasuta TaxID=863751 RepID=UPI0034CEA13E